MIEQNIMLQTDSYKISHAKLYPKGLEYMQSYFESRVDAKWDTTVFFGLQYYLKKYLEGQQVTLDKIQQAKELWGNHLGNDKIFNEEGWKYIYYKYDGTLPVKIHSLPEGTVVPNSCAMMTIQNSDKKCAWLPNWLETLLVKLWGPCTVSTQSREIRKVIRKYVEQTCDNPEIIDSLVDFMCHCFGYRGVFAEEQAGLAGGAHLLSFLGSDTFAAEIFLRNYYHGAGLVSASIPASEHSTVTTWGEDGEGDFIKNALKQYPTGLLANVIDSYDPKRFVMKYALENKELILARDGKYIFRPDSGDPNEMSLDVLNWVGKVFGFTVNNKGFKVLNPKVGVIYGDGMNFETISDLYKHVTDAGWAAQNIAIGSGGGLLQKLNRDTQRFAFKACWAQVDGQPRNVCKHPSADPTKNSKSGHLGVYNVDGQLTTLSDEQLKERNLTHLENELKLSFENGIVLQNPTLDEVRARARV